MMVIQRFNDTDFTGRNARGVELRTEMFRLRIGLMLRFDRPTPFERYRDEGYFHVRLWALAITYREE